MTARISRKVINNAKINHNVYAIEAIYLKKTRSLEIANYYRDIFSVKSIEINPYQNSAKGTYTISLQKLGTGLNMNLRR